MYAYICRYVCIYTYTYASLRLMPPRPAADAALTHTGERVVGGVLPRIGIGDGVCVIVYV